MRSFTSLWTSLMRGSWKDATISAEPSVEPSLTINNSKSENVCDKMLSSAGRRYALAVVYRHQDGNERLHDQLTSRTSPGRSPATEAPGLAASERPIALKMSVNRRA